MIKYFLILLTTFTPIMNLKIKKLYPDSKIPTKANPTDAGYDVYAHSMNIVGKLSDDFHNTIPEYYDYIDYIEYGCGIAIQPDKYEVVAKPDAFGIDNIFGDGYVINYFTYLAPRSSLSKYSLIQSNSIGVIDAGFLGELKIRFKYHTNETWNNGAVVKLNHDKIYKIGDKIGQLIVTMQPIVNIVEVENLDNTVRGDKAYGSSGN